MLLQFYYNAITMPFQCHFNAISIYYNAISILCQCYYYAITMLLRCCFNAIEPKKECYSTNRSRLILPSASLNSPPTTNTSRSLSQHIPQPLLLITAACLSSREILYPCFPCFSPSAALFELRNSLRHCQVFAQGAATRAPIAMVPVTRSLPRH